MRQDLFEYAVIRIVPQVEREEFLNVGVILYCGPQKFLGMKFTVNESRLRALNSEIDVTELSNHLKAFEKICIGGKDGGEIGQLSMPERFRWLTASRSTIVQTSKVHPGLCDDAKVKLEFLFGQLVAI
jgi:Protein of unknown function (DUF3037)